MQSARLIMYHKQSTSARTRFLLLPYGGVCAFEGLPAAAELLDAGAETTSTVALHPGALAGQAERELGFAPGSLEADGGFRAKVDVAGSPLEVRLARFTAVDPPFAPVEQSGARFIDLTQARGLPAIELLLLRQAYERILG